MATGNWKLATLFTFVICHLPFASRADVVLYTSIDQPIAAPIIKDFERSSGLRVILQTDTEATKSVGLAERIRAEKDNPQADVFWSNEPFFSVNLADNSLLRAYNCPSAGDVPDRFKDPDHRWTGNALRVRVIARFAGEKATNWPRGLDDFANTDGPIAMARPTAGTTGGHVAALYVLWGEDKARAYFRALRAKNIKLLGGNSVVAESVGRGTLWFGLTDNDDVVAAQANGGKLEMVLPDQDGVGTLLVPTTVGLVAGAKHEAEAKRLIDYLLSKEVERKLIDAKFAAFSIRDYAGKVKAMDVDYRKVAEILPRAVREATSILEGRE